MQNCVLLALPTSLTSHRLMRAHSFALTHISCFLPMKITKLLYYVVFSFFVCLFVCLPKTFMPCHSKQKKTHKHLDEMHLCRSNAEILLHFTMFQFIRENFIIAILSPKILHHRVKIISPAKISRSQNYVPRL